MIQKTLVNRLLRELANKGKQFHILICSPDYVKLAGPPGHDTVRLMTRPDGLLDVAAEHHEFTASESDAVDRTVRVVCGGETPVDIHRVGGFGARSLRPW